MLGGLFRLFLLNKLFGGAGRTGGRGGRGRGGCGMGAGCLVLIVIVILAFLLLRGCGDGAAPVYDF